jgi:hypothetical protein
MFNNLNRGTIMMECPFIARKECSYFCDITNEEIDDDTQNRYCWNICYTNCPHYMENKKDSYI